MGFVCANVCVVSTSDYEGMTPKLAFCTSYYNDRECLKRELSSILPVPKRWVPYVRLIMVDGRYKGFLGTTVTQNSSASTDGSYEMIESVSWGLGHPIAHAVAANRTERIKRQMYVDIAAGMGCDFIIMVDADEWFEPRIKWDLLFAALEEIKEDKEALDKKRTVYSICCIDEDKDGNEVYRGYRPRLWYRPEMMEYTTAHCRFKRRDVSDYSKSNPVGRLSEKAITMRHNRHNCRTARRSQAQLRYEKRLPGMEVRT